MELGKIIGEACDLFRKYNHEYEIDTVGDIVTESYDNKAEMRALLSKHSGWNSEGDFIRINTDFFREYDRDTALNAIYWVEDAVESVLREKYAEERKTYSNIWDLCNYFTVAIRKAKMIEEYAPKFMLPVEVNGMNIEQMSDTLAHLREMMSKEEVRVRETHYIPANNEERETLKRISVTTGYLETLIDGVSVFITPEMEDRAKDLGIPHVHRGAKISKVIQKLVKELDLGIENINPTRLKTWYDNNGQYHEREVPDGFNARMTELCDALSPVVLDYQFILSTNPLDCWTMSFFPNSASCHTIDKANKRGVNSSHVYGGCYCAGTTSYARDDKTAIAYLIPKSYDGNEPWEVDKIERAVVTFSDNFTEFYLGRVYPDGRDKGDIGFAKQMREVIQGIISSVTDNINSWKTIKGTEETERLENLGGCAYRDWTVCDDCSISYLKVNGSVLNTNPRIRINSPARCLCCGNEYYGEYNENCKELNCPDCIGSTVTCRCCDDTIRLNCDEYIYSERDDRYFCCENCAEEYGYVEIDGEWYDTSDHDIHQDAYTDEWFIDDGCGDAIHIGDDWFVDADDARSYGYVWCETDEMWAISENTECDDLTGECFVIDEHLDYIEIISSRHIRYVFLNEENARAYGCVQIDDEWYIDDDTAVDSYTGEVFVKGKDTITIIKNGNTFTYLSYENATKDGWFVDVTARDIFIWNRATSVA